MKKISNFMYLIVLLGLPCNLYGWENKFTHPAITEESVNSSAAQIDDYLKTQLGLEDGLTTELYWDFPAGIKDRIKRGDKEPDDTTRNILEWLKVGSTIEDEDGKKYPWRPRHHFHDPIRNAGLDNHTDHPNWDAPFWSSWLPLGQSALVWATDGTASQEPTVNNKAWEDARVDFYLSLIMPEKADREEYLAITFLDLGCVLHMLEDMGVPAHTRNDFLFGHYRSVYKWDWGNPLEGWVEEQIRANGGQSPWSGSGPVIFDKLAEYFDTDTRDANDYLGNGVLPPDTWGLSESTNYQFLSLSTVFGCSGIKYQFPHPAKENAEPNLLEPAPGVKKVYFDGSNYGVLHLARDSYTHYVSGGFGASAYPVIDSTITTDDEKVFIDYANITIPRTIDYATGLLNYFFRGRLSVEADCIDCNEIELTITNDSNNSGVPQTLKGGTYELYWDDADGNRAEVSGFTVDGWNSSSTLAYGDSVTGTFTQPEANDIAGYILVYKGNICENPNQPDTDDSEAIAVANVKDVYSDDCFLCDTNKTPKSLTVTFSGLIACTGCYKHPYYNIWYKFINPIPANLSYIVPFYGDYGTYCHWTLQNAAVGSSFTMERYLDSNCSNFLDQFVYSLIQSDVVLYDTGKIRVQLVWTSSGFAHIFRNDYTSDEPDSNCVDGTYSNFPPCGIPDTAATVHVCSGGTATVVVSLE